MSDPTSELATRTGIDPETTTRGLGALLTFVKEHLGTDIFDRLHSALPNAPAMMQAYESGKDSQSPGLLGSLAGLAGSLLGGKVGEGANLLEMLSKAGLDPSQIQTFLTGAFEHLQGILPADLLEKLRARLPLSSPSESAEVAAP